MANIVSTLSCKRGSVSVSIFLGLLREGEWHEEFEALCGGKCGDDVLWQPVGFLHNRGGSCIDGGSGRGPSLCKQLLKLYKSIYVACARNLSSLRLHVARACVHAAEPRSPSSRQPQTNQPCSRPRGRFSLYSMCVEPRLLGCLWKP